MTVCEAVARALEAGGVERLFGVVGDANQNLIVELGERCGVAFVHARHEQSAVSMDDRYACFGRRLGRLRGRASRNPAAGAERPAVVAGLGVHYADAEAAVGELAAHLGAPLAVSVQAKGTCPGYPLGVGVVGGLGTGPASRQQAGTSPST